MSTKLKLKLTSKDLKVINGGLSYGDKIIENGSVAICRPSCNCGTCDAINMSGTALAPGPDNK